MAEAKETKEPTAKHPEMTTIEALTLLAQQLKPQGPLEQAGLDQATIDRVKKPPEPRKYRMIPGRSEETAATFTLHVVESKKYPNGRIVALADYKHPPGMFTWRSEGGQVPDGFPMLRDHNSGSIGDGANVQNHQLSVQYKQWRWEEFWQRDLRRHIGKEITHGHCTGEGLGLKTPWLDGKVGAVRTEPEDD